MNGVALISAHSAELGLELALSHYPDLIILDINLPGMDGYRALGKLRSFPAIKATPVIALSALAMAKDVEKGLRAGFREYLTKPIQVDDLTSALNRILELDGGAGASPRVTAAESTSDD
jgi:CheY-like chemotaxis protein